MPLPITPSPLVNFILAHSKAGESAQSIYDFASTLSDVRLKPGKWTWAGLIDIFGKPTIDALAAQIEVADKLTYDLLCGGGIDFSNSKTQDAIEAMQQGGLLDAQTAAALKAIGVEYRSPWQVMYGEAALPSIPEIDAALADIVRVDALDLLESRIRNIIVEAAASGTAVEATKALIAAEVV